MVAAIVMGTLGSILVAPIDIRTVSVTADLEVLAPEVVLATSILACLLFGALAARFLSIPQYGLIYSGAEKLRDGLDGYLEGGRDISFRGAQWPSGRNRAVIVLSRLFLRSVESVSSRFPTGSAEVFYANSRRISGELVQMASGDAREYSEPRFLNLIRGMLYVAVSSDPVGSSSRVVEDLDIGSNYQSFPHTAGDRIVRRLGLILNSRALALFGKSYGAILAVLAVLFVGPARTIEWLMSTFKP
ncbi:hypothetical protein PSA01_43640 [Pseudonocardia saturnea]|nr:hypothetical protein Pdca_50750 [Pseudonocardia autotrophica]GEC27335.1 hypothetical protein PSA01_43640 [Pseudonocardia saturnea]